MSNVNLKNQIYDLSLNFSTGVSSKTSVISNFSSEIDAIKIAGQYKMSRPTVYFLSRPEAAIMAKFLCDPLEK